MDQLAQHAVGMASIHVLATDRRRDRLLIRLDENERVLREAYEIVSLALENNKRLVPAAEWLLDNFYLIEDQIRLARKHLPKSYSNELPRLANGMTAGYPRVYALAIELVSHVDGRVDAASLTGFIAAYQTVATLRLGELWAIPIMLRLSLIENLRRVAARIAIGGRDREMAAHWAEKMLLVVERNPTDLVLVLADMARSKIQLTGAFLAELTRHLQGQSPHCALATNWLEHRLSEQGQTVDRLVQTEGQAQAADQVSIGNSISSLRFLSATDWGKFVESNSIIHTALLPDPVDAYQHMDFITRENYRHVVEMIARRCNKDERSIADSAISMAKREFHADPLQRSAHVGFFLVDEGICELRRKSGMPTTVSGLYRQFCKNYPLIIYLSGIIFCSIVAILLTFGQVAYLYPDSLWIYLLLVPAVLCCLHLSIAIVNGILTKVVQPILLPRMNYRLGIPEEQRTLVVIPTMLSNADGIANLVDDLEVRYLANRDINLHFALLTDFIDAQSESMPEDDELVQLADNAIEQLNEKYIADRGDIFFLLNRPRLWNEREGVWMGHERKRGKLSDLNGLLRGKNVDRFSHIKGDIEVLQSVRYVITLDTDTQLPRNAARKMIGTMAHPLNRPVLDKEGARVVMGYGILQPRIGVSLLSARRSIFVQLFAGDTGIDPYTRAVSDVYQDQFHEGSFIGKGIYDVDAFEKTCNQFPKNTILSHDLLEGVYARSGLLSDVELYEEYPARYLADVSRRHRWVRGDWQIAPWLFPWITGLNHKRINNPISPLSWWKIFDNLRRSIVNPMVLVLLIASWLLDFHAGVILALAATSLAPIIALVTQILRKSSDYTMETHLNTARQNTSAAGMQFIFSLAVLPYECQINLDAIIKSLFRSHWTKRRMLEWKTSSDTQRGACATLSNHVAIMSICPVTAICVLVVLTLVNSASILIAAPILALWFIAPAIAWFISRPIVVKETQLTDKQTSFLLQTARKTWRYFEVYFTQEDNWLPPDNVQERAHDCIATRTSPTNIGMALLANLSAYDFGYISLSNLIDRTAKTIGTLRRIERYRGHFYNWYDTRSLKPMPPEYVSTVDSGNLAGHLLVLRQGLLELLDAPVVSVSCFGGMTDTIDVLLETAKASISPNSLTNLQRLKVKHEISTSDLLGCNKFIKDFQKRMADSQTETHLPLSQIAEVNWWTDALSRFCTDHQSDINYFANWVNLPVMPQSIEQYAQLADMLKELHTTPTLRQVAAMQNEYLVRLNEIIGTLNFNPEQTAWCSLLQSTIETCSRNAQERIAQIEALSLDCMDQSDMDMSFLYDKTKHLFAIGYNVRDHRIDGSYYDLLASEARLGSYVAIAQDQVETEHWFAMGRLLTSAAGAPALLSWSGSMFEYLMPMLVMPSYDNTLLDQTCKAAVRRHIKYGKQRGVPWGISESGYNAFDVLLNYQYKAFGVPGLGLKRGLAGDLVIAPYASLLALMVSPDAACNNLLQLKHNGLCGAYGFYEAVDYTPSRLPPTVKSAAIKQYMVHHQGMSLLALAYVLLKQPMQRRFKADLMLRAADQLLHERVPKVSAQLFPHSQEANSTRITSPDAQGMMRVYTDPSTAAPEVHLLSNGQYHVMVTSAGGGYSRWRDLAVTRWREDATRDCWGTFVYIRDLNTGGYWSTSLQPTLKPTKHYEAIFSQSRAEFRRRDAGIETHTEICVSPEDDVELRRITLTNRSDAIRSIELTSYCEVVLASQAQDLAHPAFSNLFVQTEIIKSRQAILSTRRPRSANENVPWMVHLVTSRATDLREPSYETDRMKFLGRHHTVSSPVVMEYRNDLSNTQGPVLDPIASIRQVIKLKPHESITIDFVTGVADSRAAITALMDKYFDPNLTDRAFDLAWTHSQIQLRQVNAASADAQVYCRLAGSMIYASPLRRARAAILVRNKRGQSGLWGYGISGDLPILLVRIRSSEHLDLIRQALQAHAFWRMKGLITDLVIWNEDDSVYRQTLHDLIADLIASSQLASLLDKPGGIYIRRGEQMSEDDRALLQTVARVILVDESGTLAEQTDRRGRGEPVMPSLKVLRKNIETQITPEPTKPNLALFNGLGGFSLDGKEYIIKLKSGQSTPAPWCNVIANAEFGTVVSDAGSVYTWWKNSHEFRLTPWHNDPVSDISGEAFYIRDEETGRFFSPTPQPACGTMPYTVRHGFGYSIYEYEQDGIASELSIHVSTDSPVKFTKIKLTNRSSRTRQLSVTSYIEWVLGELRNKSHMHVITELDAISGAVFAYNTYNTEFGNSIAYVDCSEMLRTITCDRSEFMGRNGSMANPSVMYKAKLSGRIGAGLDPCTAMQVQVALESGQSKEIVFIMGAAANREQARQLTQRYRQVIPAYRELEKVWQYWNHALSAVHVETPDPAINFMANGWLLYQVLASRMWARTGFYQSGGAFGFRDQLQDAMSLIHAEPHLFREHILRAAGHQFREGDVQHWWHPPVGRGVRTHFSDDYLWLAYTTCRYVKSTGDTGILNERIAFLSGRPVRAEEDAYYDLPNVSEDVATLYDHCTRAIENGLRFGEHGLPLMGCGDWNDGMNLVGEHGKGESVWLAFFLYDVLQQFITLANTQGDIATVERYKGVVTQLQQNIERHAWDGQWYRRAYFDNGEPLGSSTGVDCQIDALPQIWSILSKAGSIERSTIAMQSAMERLVKRDDKLIKLLDPPFDQGPLNPGYIKGYVPGVRENGGQYTHAAIWTIMALAEQRDTKNAWELFNMINPLNHGSTPESIATYRVEPYVVAADVYAVAPHTGRGGWTWYTGSAGWMYRLITESLLGIRLEVDKLYINPLMNDAWSEFAMIYRYRNTTYRIMIKKMRQENIGKIYLDNVLISQGYIPLTDDHTEHQVIVELYQKN